MGHGSKLRNEVVVGEGGQHMSIGSLRMAGRFRDPQNERKLKVRYLGSYGHVHRLTV